MSVFILQALGVLTLALAVFHMLFWRIFDWREDLESLTFVNRAIMKALNVSLIYLLGFFGILSMAAANLMVEETLGRVIVAALAGFWIIRAIAQIVFFRLTKPVSIAMTVAFALMASGYVAVLV